MVKNIWCSKQETIQNIDTSLISENMMSTYASSMLGWKILFMNPKKAKTKRRQKMSAVSKKWSGAWKKMGSHNIWCNTRLPTYWWRFERVFVRKIYSHLPHTSLVRRCPWKGDANLKKRERERQRQKRTVLRTWGDLHCTEHHISILHTLQQI